MTETTTAPNEQLPRTPLTDDQIKTVAVDCFHGRLCGSWQVPNELLTAVFIPLGIGGLEMQELLKREEIFHVYEYLDKAGPRSVNDYPMFMSFKTLTKDEARKVGEIMERLAKAQASALEGA